MKEKYSVLIPDGNSKLLTVVINCLSEHKGYDIYIISDEKRKEIIYPKNLKQIFVYPNLNHNTKNEWLAYVDSLVEKYNIDVVMPIDVTAIRCLSKYKTTINKTKALGLLPPFDNFDTANHKDELSKHLILNQLPAPKTLLYSKGEVCTNPPLNFPIIMKLCKDYEGGGEGLHFFKDQVQLEQFFLKTELDCSYLLQSYISGYDIDCSVLCENGKILAFTIQKGFMKGESDFTPQLGVAFLYEKALYEVVERLMTSLNWSGVAHIDMRYDENEKDFKIIEINPRFWGSLDASIIAGVNFTHFYCLASMGITFDVPQYKNIRFLKLLGLVKTIKKNKLFLFNFRFLLKNTPLKFYKKNPWPLLYIVYYKLRAGVTKRISKTNKTS